MVHNSSVKVYLYVKYNRTKRGKMYNTVRQTTDDVYLTLKEVAQLLGLKYHHARKLLLEDTSIGFMQYNRKRLWLKSDILLYMQRHMVKPIF